MWWQRQTLLLLIAASMLARRSSATTTICPENCECISTKKVPKEWPVINPMLHDSINIDEKINENDKPISSIIMQVRCKGTVPRMRSLPSKSQRLVIEETKPHEIMKMLFELENRNNESNSSSITNIALQELAIINCSLTRLNVTLSQLFTDHSSMSLNLSNNYIAETQQLIIKEGDDADDDKKKNRLGQLDLSNNRLTRIRCEAFANYGRLVKLNLARNAIRIVEKGGFVGLGRLEILDLSGNRLDALAEDSFAPLSFLQKLNLSGNRLLMGVLGLGHRWFDNLVHLRELDVSRNKLSRKRNEDDDEEEEEQKQEQEQHHHHQIKDENTNNVVVVVVGIELSLILGSVSGRLEIIDASRIGLDRVPSALTRSVRYLNLSGNRLSIISSGDFDSYPLLRVLDLSSNNIRLIEDDALGRLEILDKLILSGNRLNQLPQSLPSSLVALEICDNFIDKIGTKDLQGLGKLERLTINNNAISEIEEGSMGQLLLLRELDISNNPIKELPANTISGPSLVAVRMSGLWSLNWDSETERADMTFPVPAPERLVSLDLSQSPALAAQLLADEATLSACKSLRILNIAQTNLTTLRSDLPYLLPQLHTLGLFDNEWNCTRANREIAWLPKWIEENEEILPHAKCRVTHNDTQPLIIMLTDLSFLPESPPRNKNYTNQLPAATQSLPEQFNNGPSAKFREFAITIGAHPGMLILGGAALGALAAAIGTALVLSHKRLGIIIINNNKKNQDTGTILPSDGVSNFIINQQPIIVTELW